jgi:anthranilate synthase component 2
MTKQIKLLMIDNYDSFTYNIVQYFGELGAQVEVFRNDEITLDEIEARLQAGQLDRLVVSPGPCSPAEAGISVAAIQHFAGKLPILGVCLGHQSIGAAFGGKIVRAPAAHARQDQRHHHHAGGCVRRTAPAVHREPLSLAGD